VDTGSRKHPATGDRGRTLNAREKKTEHGGTKCGRTGGIVDWKKSAARLMTRSKSKESERPLARVVEDDIQELKRFGSGDKEWKKV